MQLRRPTLLNLGIARLGITRLRIVGCGIAGTADAGFGATTRGIDVNAKRAKAAYAQPAQIRSAYPKTIRVATPGGRDPEQWLVMGFAACFAILGTNLSRRFLDRMSDKQFYSWTRKIILGIGVVYMTQGIWQMVHA